LRSMLVAGDQIAIPPESYVWPRIIRKYTSLSFLGWNTISKLVISEFEAYGEFYTWKSSFSELYNKVINLPKNERSLATIIDMIYCSYSEQAMGNALAWGDKTPINTIHLKKILKIFPNAKIIHIVRDPRDVVSSYLKAGLYENPNDASDFWNLCIGEVQKVKKSRKFNLHEVRYEDLVVDPEKELKSISQFINITYKIEMLEFHRNYQNLGDTIHHNHHKNLSNPLNPNSIGKWKNVLEKSVIDNIQKSCNRGMEIYNYFS